MIVFDIFQLDSILTLTGCSEVNEVFNQCSSLPILEGCWLYLIMVIFEYCRISAWQCIYTVVLAYVSIWQSEACSLQLYSPVQPCSVVVYLHCSISLCFNLVVCSLQLYSSEACSLQLQCQYTFHGCICPYVWSGIVIC